MLSGAWCAAAQICGPIYYAGGARGLVLVSDIFRDASSGGALLAHFSGSCRLEKENQYGLRLTTKPLPRDHIEHPVTRPSENLGVPHFEVWDADSLAPLAGGVSD